jgi:hypothetical protein
MSICSLSLDGKGLTSLGGCASAADESAGVEESEAHASGVVIVEIPPYKR